MKKNLQFLSGRPWLIILGLAVIVRLIYFITRYPYAGEDFLLVDTLFHHKWAVAIASGDWLGSEAFFRAPLYPYVLGLVYFILGKSAHIGFAFGQILGLVSIFLTYRIALRTFGSKAAIIAALFQTLYPITIFFEGELLVEGLFIVLAQASILCVFRAVEDNRWRWPLWTGVFIGLAAITRPVILALIPLYFIWYFVTLQNARQRTLKAIIIVAAMLLVILPVALRNIMVGHDSTLIASSGGINFYIGNNKDANGLSPALPPPLGSNWQLKDVQYLAEQGTGHAMKPSEVSSYFYQQGLQWIFVNKTDFVKLYVKKLYYVFNNFEISNNRNIVLEFSRNGLLKIIPISLWLVIGLAAIGLFAKTDGRMKSRFKSFLIFYTTLYILIISMYFINARFRLPFLFALFTLAGAGTIYLYESIKAKRFSSRFVVALLSGVFIAGLSLTNLYHHNAQDVSSGLFNRANAYFAAGDLQSAAETYREVLAVHPDYPEAALNLGAVYLKAGLTDSARVYFEREYKLQPDDPRALANLASLQYLDNHPDSAITLADKAISLRPYLADPYLVKLRSLAAMDDTNALHSVVIKAQRAVPEPWRIYLDAGIIYSEKQDYQSAEKYLKMALAAKPEPSETSDAAFSNINKLGGRDAASIRARAAYQLGFVFGKTGDFQESVTNSNLAIAIDSSLTEAYINLISGYLSLGEMQKARNVLNIADRKFPQNATINILKSRMQ